MLDPKLIRNNPESVKKGLKMRQGDASLVDKFLAIDEEWRKVTIEVEELQAKRNKVSDEIAEMKKNKQDASCIIAQMKEVSARIKELTDKQKESEAAAQKIALEMVLLNTARFLQ